MAHLIENRTNQSEMTFIGRHKGVGYLADNHQVAPLCSLLCTFDRQALGDGMATWLALDRDSSEPIDRKFNC
jgi:hypothetical protein